MSFHLSNSVRYLEHPEANGTAKSVLRNLLDHADDDGTNIFPSISTICKETGFDRKAVFKTLNFLKGTFLELCESINLGGRIGKVNKFKLIKENFINSITNQKEKERVMSFLFSKELAHPQSGTSKAIASPQKGFASPQSGTQLNQYSNITNTNNNNTNHLGRDKYLEVIPSFKADVVVPTEYIRFDELPQPASKAAKTGVEPQEKITALGENPKASIAAGTMMELQKSKPEKIEIERQELPLSVVNAMNEAKFEGSKYIRRSLIRWVEQYGEAYVIEKIKILESDKWYNKNAALTQAIRWDWKENPKSERASLSEQQSAPFCKVVDSLPSQKKRYPCGIEWWNSLSSEHRREIVARHWRYDEDFLAVMGYDVKRDFYDSERFFSSSDFRSICIDYSKEHTKKLVA